MRIVDAGMLTSVQDLGRPGFAAIGVPGGGAADPLSLRIGNRLLGNADGATGVEMTMLGGTFVFEHDAEVVLAGGEARAAVESASGGKPRPVSSASPMRVHAGERLRVGPITRGVRAYLCIRGGLRVPVVMRSASTFLGAGFGGVEGRALRRGDALEWADGPVGPSRISLAAAAALLEEMLARRTLRAVAGAQVGGFDAASIAAFWGSSFGVSSRSDRVGVRLQGSVGVVGAGKMASEGMMCGAVQVPPAGEPIVLLVDHPTTGGYPVIACVASVDVPILGQLRPGERVRFERCTPEAALELLRERERGLESESVPT